MNDKLFCAKCGQQTDGLNHTCKEPSQLDIMMGWMPGTSEDLHKQSTFEVATNYKNKFIELQKERDSLKSAIQLMEHGKYGRVDLTDQIQELTLQLAEKVKENERMRVALREIGFSYNAVRSQRVAHAALSPSTSNADKKKGNGLL